MGLGMGRAKEDPQRLQVAQLLVWLWEPAMQHTQTLHALVSVEEHHGPARRVGEQHTRKCSALKNHNSLAP
jgi:hypothetical protein